MQIVNITCIPIGYQPFVDTDSAQQTLADNDPPPPFEIHRRRPGTLFTGCGHRASLRSQDQIRAAKFKRLNASCRTSGGSSPATKSDVAATAPGTHRPVLTQSCLRSRPPQLTFPTTVSGRPSSAQITSAKATAASVDRSAHGHFHHAYSSKTSGRPPPGTIYQKTNNMHSFRKCLLPPLTNSFSTHILASLQKTIITRPEPPPWSSCRLPAGSSQRKSHRPFSYQQKAGMKVDAGGLARMQKPTKKPTWGQECGRLPRKIRQ
ncbi:uncharacterized protein LOC119238872 [Talpa occidentalis]|uniref:uncharacterized protein LOC119238872 n=1 Tax=Talpa occidentalis TaxID=50954 RepID=UPI0023F6CF13|nr:uncharacterized protein LOC119238872 [Talpa occidentalis]